MAGQYVKPANMKYTDMCIFIDNNFEKVIKDGEDIGLEAKIFEYIYHIVYALSFKQDFFRNFSDYNPFSLFAATELYLAMKNKYLNAGKEVRGMVIQPVKSCLNYIKSVLFPLKVNYQRQNFAAVYDSNLEGKDISKLYEDIKNNVRQDYKTALNIDLAELNRNIPHIVSQVVQKSPYRRMPEMLSRIRISCILTLTKNLTLPLKAMNKIKKKGDDLTDSKIVEFYQDNANSIVLWHLPSHMRDYIQLLVTEIKHKLSDELEDMRSSTDLSDEIVDDILNSAYSMHGVSNTGD